MKRLSKLFVVVILLSFSGLTSMAQSKKFAHVDWQGIVSVMAKKDSVEVKYQKYVKDLQDNLEELQVELNNLFEEYQNLPEGTPQLKKKDMEKQINSLQERIRSYQQEAQMDIQQKEAELLQPIYEKIKAAIKELGDSNGYIYVMDINSVLYYSKESQDITDLVKKKLNVE